MAMLSFAVLFTDSLVVHIGMYCCFSVAHVPQLVFTYPVSLIRPKMAEKC